MQRLSDELRGKGFDETNAIEAQMAGLSLSV